MVRKWDSTTFRVKLLTITNFAFPFSMSTSAPSSGCVEVERPRDDIASEMCFEE